MIACSFIFASIMMSILVLYNLGILSFIGDPPKDGQFAYYPETAGFKLRVRCRGKVTTHQWPKAQYP